MSATAFLKVKLNACFSGAIIISSIDIYNHSSEACLIRNRLIHLPLTECPTVAVCMLSILHSMLVVPLFDCFKKIFAPVDQ